MTEKKVHADFEATDESHRWKGKLEELGRRMRDTAWKLKGEWAWVVLPHGALVSMRVRADDFRKELRIARRGVGISEKAVARWQTEVSTFLKHLDCESWKCTLEGIDPEGGKLEVVYLEPTALSDAQRRTADDMEPCAGCGTPIKKSLIYSVNRCTGCAMKAGAEEAAKNNEARAQGSML